MGEDIGTTSGPAPLPLPRPAPRVSVVMPTHRRAEMLQRALASLETQAHPREAFEVIVVATAGDLAFETVREFAARGRMDVRCVSVPDDPTAGRSPALKRNF